MSFLAIISLFFAVASSYHTKEKIRGVDLGGWLVMEPWIRPSLFAQWENTSYENTAIDEFSFNKRLGREEAQRQLEEHWSTWVQEEDFRKIKEYGLTHVRLPFGWWIFGDSPDYYSNISHLDRGLDLAHKYGIKVLLDMHTAPGSQNGFDNSGIVCKTMQYGNSPATDTQEIPQFALNHSNMELATKILKKVALRYKDHPAVWGLEFVNEPYWGIDLDVLKQWYVDTYHTLRHIIPNWQLVMEESFRPYAWTDFMKNETEYNNVIIDSHIYMAFNNNVIEMTNEDDILRQSCVLLDQAEFMVSRDLPTIVGEWSLAVDDCAKYLNGFLTRTRKEDMGRSCSEPPHSNKFYRAMAKNQLYAFEKTEGWMFWNFKNELEDDWSWFRMVELGWVPHNARDIPEFVKDSICAKKNFLPQ